MNTRRVDVKPESYFEGIRLALVNAKYDDKKVLSNKVSDRFTLNPTFIADARKLKVDPYDYYCFIVCAFVNAKNAMRRVMYEEIKREVKIKNNPALKGDMKKLAINPEKYLVHFSSPRMKRKCDWDYIYYNCNHKLITCKQYKRNISSRIKSRNYPYDDIVDDFGYYDNYLTNIMPKPDDTNEDYYRKTMDYYHLEVYKKIDFAYKLAVRLEDESLIIDKNHFLVKRFTPVVVYPFVKDGQLYFGEKQKYYRPLIFIEDEWQKQGMFDHTANYALSLQYHLVRAKAYELFNYQFAFIFDDYDDIAGFLRGRDDDNIVSYHDKDKKWFVPEKEKLKDQTARIKKAQMILEALFWKSEKREPVEWKKPEK